MIRWVLLAALLSAPMVIDRYVVWQFQQVEQDEQDETGYSESDRSGMARLIEQTLATPAKQMSRAEQAAALKYLWGDCQ